MNEAKNIKINNPLTIAGSGFCRRFEVTTNQSTMTNLQSQPEIFKPILDFEGEYEISNYGNVKSLTRVTDHPYSGPTVRKGRLMKINITWAGYCRVALFKDGKYFKYPIHRLVAIHFIPNPNEYDQVNHKDGNKQNNHVDNLEWCNASQNILHRYHVLGFVAPRKGVINKSPHMKSVVQLSLSGEEIRTFLSSADAGRSGFNPTHVSGCCNGKRLTHKGFKWKYKTNIVCV